MTVVPSVVPVRASQGVTLPAKVSKQEAALRTNHTLQHASKDRSKFNCKRPVIRNYMLV